MTTANREKLEEQLLELLYGELPDADVAALESQLANHPDLQARLDEWHELRRVVAEMPLVEPDPQVRYDLLRAARKAVAEPERRGWWAWFERLSAAPAVAGLALAVIAGSILFTITGDFSEHGPENTVTTPAETLRVENIADAATVRPVTLNLNEERAVETPAAASGDQTASAVLDGLVDRKAAARPATETVKGDRRRAIKKSTPKPRRKAKPSVRKSKTAYAPKKKARRSKKAYRSADLFEDGYTGPGPRSAKKSVSAPPVVNQAAVAPKSTQVNKFAPPPAENRMPRGVAAQPPSPPRAAESEKRDRYEENKQGRVDAEASLEATQTRFLDPVDESASDDAVALPMEVKPESLRGAMSRSSGMGARSASDEGAGRTTTGLSTILGRARAARQRGAHRIAVREYETYLKRTPGKSDLSSVWFEAAQSYEALGDLRRARQLYRLVARSKNNKAGVARSRLEELERQLDVGDPSPKAKSVPKKAF